MSHSYDVVIVGASFAGLATAMQLRGHRVMLLDQYPVGTHPISACGTPLATAQAVDATCALQEIHHAIVLHTGSATVRFKLRDPYITFDYGTFCHAMLAQTDVEYRQSRALELHSNCVMTDNGPIAARFVVNAAGWHRQLAQDSRPARPSKVVGYGLETEMPMHFPQSTGLQFYFERRIVANGYAWIFPCGQRVRIGVGSFAPNVKLRPRLEDFLGRFDLQLGDTHGGVLAIERREPIAGGVFSVGDAAGQCLPVTGEGIRTAIFHGIHCGRAIAHVLQGRLSPDEAFALYRDQVCSMDRFHARLLHLQMLIARSPEWLLAWGGRICSVPPLTQAIMTRYLVNSGWLVGESA